MKLSITSVITLFILNSIAMAQVTVMSYNIRYATSNDGENWWENRKQDVSALIKLYHPDFIGIQEGLDHQVSYLDQTLDDYNYVGTGRDGEGVISEYTAIYYDKAKFALVETNTFWLSETPNQVSKGWDAALNRIATYAVFEEKSTGNHWHVFNTHFDHMGSKARESSARLIVEQISSWKLIEQQLIIMGDLNSLPDSPPISVLNETLIDTRTIADGKSYGPDGTFNGFDSDAELKNRIDYVFVKNLEVIRQRHIEDLRPNLLWPSDHLPVFAEVKSLQ